MTEGTPQATQPYEPKDFAEMLGTETLERGEGWARVRMPILPRHKQGAGVVQGGVIMTLADQALSSAVGTLSRGMQSVTVELKVNFIASARDGALIGEGRVTHKGNLISVAEGAVRDEGGKLIALAMGTWMTLRPQNTNSA